ncbi:hypothetical protein ACROYT_G013392 [Oculina patagonica]
MAARGHHLRPKSAEENFTCPVCLEILESPILIPCGHTFCNDCLDSCENISGSATCPVCRSGFSVYEKHRARDIQRQIHQSSGTCSGCNRQFPMSRLREHRSSCTITSHPTFSPVASTSQPWPETKNRSTFTCPFCYQRNLDSNGLLQHVNSNHKNERQSVVCPICASMPWGNPHQKSGDFVQHLNLRHKFEYDTFVDYDNDEDAILQQVLAQSMEDR